MRTSALQRFARTGSRPRASCESLCRSGTCISPQAGRTACATSTRSGCTHCRRRDNASQWSLADVHHRVYSIPTDITHETAVVARAHIRHGAARRVRHRPPHHWARHQMMFLPLCTFGTPTTTRLIRRAPQAGRVNGRAVRTGRNIRLHFVQSQEMSAKLPQQTH